MKSWLLKKEGYRPLKGGVRFLNKTLLSVLSVLSQLRRPEKENGGWVYRLHPAIKLVSVTAAILSLSLSRSAGFIYLAGSSILLAVALLDADDLKACLLVSGAVTFFGLLILLPAILTSGGKNSALLLAKIAGSALSINFLSHSTKWRHVTRALYFFRFPSLFLLILELAMKYIVILGEFSLHMLQALRARSVGHNPRAHRELSNLAGVLFIKSREMAELTHSAMECRCFTGDYPVGKPRPLYAGDFVFIAANAALASAFLWFSIKGY